MGDCSNLECIHQTWGDKIRCSQCRHARNYICASCGYDIPNARAIYCKECSWKSHVDKMVIFQSKPEQKIIIAKRRRDKYRNDKLEA